MKGFLCTHKENISGIKSSLCTSHGRCCSGTTFNQKSCLAILIVATLLSLFQPVESTPTIRQSCDDWVLQLIDPVNTFEDVRAECTESIDHDLDLIDGSPLSRINKWVMIYVTKGLMDVPPVILSIGMRSYAGGKLMKSI